jgi:hypothetical protein
VITKKVKTQIIHRPYSARYKRKRVQRTDLERKFLTTTMMLEMMSVLHLGSCSLFG